MPVNRILAILALMEALEALEAADHMESCLSTACQHHQPTCSDKRKRNVKAETSSNGELVVEDKAFFFKENLTTKQTTMDSNLSEDQTARSPSPRCHKNGRKRRMKRCRYKLSDELNKKETAKDILAQLDYDIEEQEMDKRSRIELLSYLDAALKNKNIELNMELRHLAKEEENLSDKVQEENVNSNAAVLAANIEQLNKRITDLDERALRMKKMREQKLLEKIPDVKTLKLLNRQNYMNARNQPSSATESEQQTSLPLHLTSVDVGKTAVLKDLENTVSLPKQALRPNFGYVPYQMPMLYSDPLQILRLTNPDFAALAHPAWQNSGWAGYAPNLYPYPVERQDPRALYAALARQQALPVPLRKW